MIFNLIKALLASFLHRSAIRKHISESPHKDTLYSLQWLFHNYKELLNTLPDVWTHEDNIDYTQFGLEMNILNVHWETRQDLKDILTYLESLHLLSRKNSFHVVKNMNNKFSLTLDAKTTQQG